MEIVSDDNTIPSFQQQFMEELLKARTEVIRCYISWRPMAEEADVNWSQNLKMWWWSKPLDNRWWNVFGVSKPLPYSNVGIAAEINFLFSGIDRRIAAAFAKEGKKIFVVHRGNRLGGGKGGINKLLFWDNYHLKSNTVTDGDRMARVAVVCELGSQKLPNDVAEFVNEVVRIKKLV